MKNYTVTKTTVECYKIRVDNEFDWADITIDANGTKGRISISSDFGSYANYWNACGIPFKDFLAKIGIDYAAGKFGADRWFDYEATINHYKEQVLEYRRSESLTALEARKAFNEIKLLTDCTSETEFCSTLSGSCDALMKFYDYCPNLVRTITPQFKSLWTRIWPVLLREFEKEKLELTPH
jgi:hypothetical protein